MTRPWFVLLTVPLIFRAGAASAQADEPSGAELRERAPIVTLSPLAIQLNSRFNQHVGSSVGAQLDVTPRFGAGVEAQFNWVAGPSDRTRQLIERVRQKPLQAIEDLFLPFVAELGLHFILLEGESGSRVPARLLLTLGGGVAQSRVFLLQDRETGADLSGSTGLLPLGSTGVQFEMRPLQRLWVRGGLRARFISASISTINGCNGADLDSLSGTQRAGRPLDSVFVSAGCDVGSFSGVTEEGARRDHLAAAAHDALQQSRLQAVALFRQISFSVGAGYEF